ncbi:AAA family ATPase [Algoriphagus iocasae]|nr:AAA family ATPase [Algoriphagus iocasae]
MSDREIDTAFDFVKNTNLSFFLTGRAGTGKSTFLRNVVSTVGKNFVVLAPTGIAALNVNGVTIHSFFQFPPRPLLPKDKGIKTFWEKSEKRKLIASLDTLILDEVSMIRADIIDAIDFSLRKNGGNPNLPFGGKQIIFVGDLYQLEPIIQEKNGEAQTLGEFYEGLRFYQAQVFKHLKLFTIELSKVYRQKDLDFISLLDKVRTKSLNHEELNHLNTRVIHETVSEVGNHTLTLTTTLDAAQKINQSRLSEINGNPFLYKAEISGDFDPGAYPSDLDLKLKVGTQVIFTKNHPEGKWVNGSLGVVKGCSDNLINIELENSTICEVERDIWESVKYQFNKDTNKVEQEVIGSYKQFPIKPAWAITIHKSQGMTFERLNIDFGNGTFACGQAYVALSRVTSFNGLLLNRKIHHSDIQVDHSVNDFLQETIPHNLHALLSTGKTEFAMLKGENPMLLGNLYLHQVLTDIVESDYKKGYEHLLKAFAYTSNDQDIVRDQNFINLLAKAEKALTSSFQINKPSYRLSLLTGTVYFFLRRYSSVIQILKPALKHDDSSIAHYMLARSLWNEKEFSEALNITDTALSLAQNSRNYLLKATILNPFLEENVNNELVSKSLYLESYIQALNFSSTNMEAFEAIRAFIVKEGMKVDLPSLMRFKQELLKNQLDETFFEDILVLINRNKRELLRCAAKAEFYSNAVELNSEESIFETDDDLIDDISEDDLIEDLLDEFLDDDTNDYY